VLDAPLPQLAVTMQLNRACTWQGVQLSVLQGNRLVPALAFCSRLAGAAEVLLLVLGDPDS
jgi:hypothetical protein